MEIIRIECQKIEKKLCMPFTTALGTHTSLENLFIKLHFKNHQSGIGECPIATHILGNTCDQSQLAIQKWSDSLVGKSFTTLQELSDSIPTLNLQEIPAKAAIEMAFWDAQCKLQNQSIAQSLNPSPKKLQTSITLVIAELEEMLIKANEFAKMGFKVFKVKIGRNVENDTTLLTNLHERFPEASFIVDANQGYQSKDALLLLEHIERYQLPIRVFEQPVAATDWTGLNEVKKNSSIPIAADESLKTYADAQRLADEGLCDIFNIKLAKIGISEAIRITKLAKSRHIDLMMGMMMESSIGLSAAAQFATGFTGFETIDLDTPFYLNDGLCECYFMQIDGLIDISKIKYGIGFEDFPT